MDVLEDVKSIGTNSLQIENDKPLRSKFSHMSDALISTISITYIIFMLALGLILFIIAAVKKETIYAEIYTLILMTISFIYLSYLMLDIYFSRKRAQHQNNQNLEMQAYLNNTHSDMFYLRIGACVFLLGILIHSSLIVTFEITLIQRGCGSNLAIVFEASVAVFSLFLLLFNLKFGNVVINRNVIWARFFIIHCVVISVTIGLYKIISEVQESLHGMRYFRSMNFNCEDSGHLGSLYKSFAPYLYPFIVEFYILNAGIFSLIWFRIGQAYNSVSLKGSHEFYIDFSGSYRGLLSGFLLVAITICFIVLSYVITAERDYFQLGLTIDEIFELVVFVVVSVTVIIAFVQTSKLSVNEEHVRSMDDVLLFIGVPGAMAQTVLCLIPAIWNGATIIICKSIFQIFQVFLQTPFIISRLRCNNSKSMKIKPGRESVTFLAIANLSLWIFYAFSNHGAGLYEHTSALYGKTAWKILYYLTIPFVMFYRFHSSVCLAHIWRHSYAKKL